MASYLVFGGTLESDLPFPELFTSEGPPRWTLETVPGPAVRPAGADLLGEDKVTVQARVRLYRTPAAWWLEFDDTGCFEIPAAGRSIRWYRPGPDLEDSTRSDVLGRVLGMVMHAEGMLCLHGSAVSVENEAIGFLAPKHHGKSTLALAMVRAGARLLTDDTLVIDMTTPPQARPGVHAMRLWGDSASRLLGDDAPSATGPGGKLYMTDLPAEQRMTIPARLGAIYLVSPVQPGAGRAPVERRRLAPGEATLALVGHGKLAALLGKSEAAVTLKRASEVARAVPVYALSVVRDFEQLDDGVAQILAWHGVRAAHSSAGDVSRVP